MPLVGRLMYRPAVEKLMLLAPRCDVTRTVILERFAIPPLCVVGGSLRPCGASWPGRASGVTRRTPFPGLPPHSKDARPIYQMSDLTRMMHGTFARAQALRPPPADCAEIVHIVDYDTSRRVKREVEIGRCADG